MLLTKLDRILVVIAGVISVIWLTCFKHEIPTSIANVPDDYVVGWKSIGNVVPTHEPQESATSFGDYGGGSEPRGSTWYVLLLHRK